MAKIYWRDGWAYARATVSGVERRECLGTQSSREAEERFQRWLTDVGVKKQSKWNEIETPFAKAVGVFSDQHLPTLKPMGQKRYLVSLIALTPFFKDKTLQDITKADLMQFVAARRKAEVADATIRRDLSCLSSVFTIAADWELCDDNPVLPFLRTQKRRKRLIEADPRTRYLSHVEERLILERAKAEFEAVNFGRTGNRALQKLMILAAVAIAIDSGLRLQELLHLEWSNVDLEAAQVTVLAAFSKTKKARIVPLLPRSLRIFQGLQQHRHADTNLALWHRDGKKFYDLNHSLQRIAGKAGVTAIRWHDLRKTCGCRLLQDYQMPIERVSLWLGHSSVKQTQDAYAFLDVKDLHHAIGNVGLIEQGKDELQQLQLPDWTRVAGKIRKNR